MRITGGKAVSFQSFMTDGIFALLSERSVLCHPVGTTTADPGDLAQAVARALNASADVMRGFSHGAPIGDLTPERASAQLSGLPIGLGPSAART